MSSWLNALRVRLAHARPAVNALTKAVWVGAGVVAVFAVSLSLIQHKLIYHPRRYDHPTTRRYYTATKRAFAELDGVTLHLPSSSPKHDPIAYFVPPKLLPKDSRVRVWLLFGGNGQLALDWLPLVRHYVDAFAHAAKTTGFCMVEYPGYGESQGSPSPESILAASRHAVRAVAAQLRISEDEIYDRVQFSVLGHSLGSAAALQFAASAPLAGRVDRVVLTAPFTSMLDMSRLVVGRLPGLSLLLRHHWDNKQRLAELHALSTQVDDLIEQQQQQQAWTGCRVTIIHGKSDSIVPVDHGRTLFLSVPAESQSARGYLAATGERLAAHSPPGRDKLSQASPWFTVDYVEVEADHNDTLDSALHAVTAAMLD